MKYHFPQYQSLFPSQIILFSCISSIIEIEDVSTNFSKIQWLSFILSWTIVQKTQSTQTKHADCPQLHRDVRQQYLEIDNIIIHCIAWATNRYNRLWFEWTNNAIRIWTAATKYSTKPEQFEPSAQSNQYSGNNAGSKPSLKQKDMTKTRAHNHRSFRNRHRYRRPPMNLSTIEGRRHLTRQRMTIYSTPMMNPGTFFF